MSQAKNRAASSIQITAEQLLREARDRGLEKVEKAPRQFITDAEELKLYQQGKRREFEDHLRGGAHKMSIWAKYALWEAAQQEFERARSIFERALDQDPSNINIYSKYAEMEAKNKFINHARNVYDRAVSYLPRVDSFWYKYTYMEELVGQVDNARGIFERWMKWEPEDTAWYAYINFEMRQGKIAIAREVYEKYVICHPTSQAYLKYAKWEEKQHQLSLARSVFERSLEEVHPFDRSPFLLISFARFEERCKEIDRARVVYKFAIDAMSKTERSVDVNSEEVEDLKKEFLNFEKRHGSRQDIEAEIINRRRGQYESAIEKMSYDYDSWFDYIRLEEAEDNQENARALYERAVMNIPPLKEKKYWRRYIYLWINYALFEEMQCKNMENTRAVYKRCLDLIPHKIFTFGKIWRMAAHFEVRQKDMAAARKVLGKGIGVCPLKENIYKGYIELEMQIGEHDRCRTLYTKYIENMPYNTEAWKEFAALETRLGEVERARSIYQIAIKQPMLDMPESLWKDFIDFEMEEEEYSNVRGLYTSLLSKTRHVKVWLAYAQFEISLVGKDGNDVEEGGSSQGYHLARDIFKRAYSELKEEGKKEERLYVLEAWLDMESSAAHDPARAAEVEAMFPKKVKLRRKIVNEAGAEVGFEDYFDYQFPDDVKKIVNLKLLENAMKWKLMTQAQETLNQGAMEASIDMETGNGNNNTDGGSSDDIDVNNDVNNHDSNSGYSDNNSSKSRGGEVRKEGGEVNREELDIDDI